MDAHASEPEQTPNTDEIDEFVDSECGGCDQKFNEQDEDFDLQNTIVTIAFTFRLCNSFILFFGVGLGLQDLLTL